MTSTSDSDVDRIRSLYRSREHEGEFWDFRTFHNFQPQVYFNESLFKDHLIEILRRDGYDFRRADEARLVEIGCGWGRNLYAFLEVGFRAANVLGIDLMEHFIERGRLVNPALRLEVGNGAQIGEPSGSVDVVLCHTVLSAILDEQLHRRVIGEALRVLKPGGLLVIYDILSNYPERSARTADGREAVFIRPVPPEVITAYAGERATRVYFRSMGLRPALRAAIFHAGWRAVGRKLRIAQGAAAPRRGFYTARACLARTLGMVPMLRTHFILALKRSDRP